MLLFVVESPGKVRPIQGYLDELFGRGQFQVVATVGHFCGLPKMDGQAFTDVVNTQTWTESWEVHKPDVFKRLRAAVPAAAKVYLATDADREGEAIAWHVARSLNLPADRIARIRCREITKSALQHALQAPSTIDLNLVAAQRARQVLDYELGMELSRPLWRFGCRSAGRVQSAAVRLIVEREAAITGFTPQTYHTIDAVYAGPLTATLHTTRAERLAGELAPSAVADDDAEGEDAASSEASHQQEGQGARSRARLLKIADVKVAHELVALIRRSRHAISAIDKKETIKKPPPPFTTSSLLSTASKVLKLSSKTISTLAQTLFEKGLVTYIRTDSTSLSDEAIADIRRVLQKKHPEVLPERPQVHSQKAHAQGAHEAIRPTKMETSPAALAELTDHERALYDLIWKRTLICQARSARLHTTTITVGFGHEHLVMLARGTMVLDSGFLPLESTPKDAVSVTLPVFAVGAPLVLTEVQPRASKTTPPRRFTEGSLTTTMERLGIGRSSTYASVLASIVDREYVVVTNQKSRELAPTELGKRSDALLRASFDTLTRSDFTASIERNFDRIAEGRLKREAFLTAFDTGFRKMLADAAPRLQAYAAENPDHDRDSVVRDAKPCSKCGAPRDLVQGRLGRMARCAAEACGYSELVAAREHSKSCCHVDASHGPMARLTKRGEAASSAFFRCLTCNYTSAQDAKPPPCPICSGPTVRRQGPRGGFWGCHAFTAKGCRGVAPEPEARPEPRKRKPRSDSRSPRPSRRRAAS